jgi:putative membrane protein
MELLTLILIGIVAAEHLFILYIELFAWETVGRKMFVGVIPSEQFAQTKVLAANQGLYNGFLAAGLIWVLFISDVIWQQNVALFFLGCVLVASMYGALTASGRILLTQGLPAALALGCVLFL